MMELLAQKEYTAPTRQLEGFGQLGLESQSGQGAPGIFNMIISRTIGVMTVVAAIWFVFQFFTGAIGWITAGGDKAKIETARQKITAGIIGLVIVVAAVFIIDLIGNLIGVDILNPAEIVNTISP